MAGKREAENTALVQATGTTEKQARLAQSIEGAVLNEMEEAQRCFDDAREATPLVSRLVPGPATRHVLGSRKAAPKGKPEAADKPAAPPVT